MPFTAYKVDASGRRDLVSVINHDRSNPTLTGGRFVCPECDQPMAFRNPWVRRPHFYHLRRDGVAVACSLASGETPEHEAGKYMVAVELASNWRYRGRVQSVHVEHSLGNRRADVAFEMLDGGLEVFEIQLATITPPELQQRTEDYYAAGATDVHWFLGKDADTPSNRGWVESVAGECVVINFRRENVTVDAGVSGVN